MIVFFALLGISCKRKIPEAHTSLEVVRIRYGIATLLYDLSSRFIFDAHFIRRSNGPHRFHDPMFDQ